MNVAERDVIDRRKGAGRKGVQRADIDFAHRLAGAGADGCQVAGGNQRQLAATGPCVVEGRDIGTVVLPGAPIKLFLTASADVRAQRRFEELSARGVIADRGATLRDQAERDHRDATRATAPLRQADDALLVDTSALGLEEVLDQIEAICRKRLTDWDKSQSH